MAQPDAAPVPDKGLFARAIGMVVSPGETFKSVVQTPRPAGILFLICLVMGLATGLPQFTERGRQATLDMQATQVERFTGQPMTPEAYTAMEQRAHYGGYITIGSMFVVIPFFTVVFGAIYWVIFNALLGGTASFKQVLAIVAHAQVISALGAVVSAPIQYIQGTQTAAGPFNLGALAPMLDPGSTLANILGGLSFFSLWQTVVSAIGLAVLYRRKAGGIAIALVALYVAIVAAFAIGFSRIFGR
jgi:hypothetical protein